MLQIWLWNWLLNLELASKSCLQICLLNVACCRFRFSCCRFGFSCGRFGLWIWIWSKDTLDWSSKLPEMLEKLSWFCLTSLITLVLMMWKFMGLFVRKNHVLRCWGWLSLLNWIGTLKLFLLLKLPLRKLESWFVLWSFFLPRLLCIFVDLPCHLVWNTAVMSELMVLTATWNC